MTCVISMAVFFLIPLSVCGQSLEDAVKLMLYNEPEIQAANFDRLSAVEDWKVARGGLRPRVSIDGGGGYVKRDRSVDGLTRSTGDGLFSRQIGISIRQLLYDGGLTRQQTLSAKRAAEAQELLERSMLEARIVDLCETYYEILRTKEQIGESQVRVNRYVEIRDMIKERAEAKSNRADLALVDGRLSLAADSLENQRLAYENALIRFVRLTGQPASGITAPVTPKLSTTRTALDVSQNWDFLASIALLEAVQHDYKRARADRGPKFYLDAGGSVGEDVLGIEGADNEVRALLTMSWDLYAGGSKKAMQEREHWQVRKAEKMVNAAQDESDYRSSLLWKERESSKTSVRLLGLYTKRLKSVILDYKEQFKVGRQTLLNILDIEEEHYSAKNRLIDASYNVETTVYRIMGVQGVLTGHLISEKNMRSYLDRNPDKDGLPRSYNLVNKATQDEVQGGVVSKTSGKDVSTTVPEASGEKKVKFLKRILGSRKYARKQLR